MASNTDSEKSYTCSLPPWDRTPSDVSCECEGYIRRGKCSHQAKALLEACDWNERSGPLQTVQQRNRFICPLCGGPTQAVLD